MAMLRSSTTKTTAGKAFLAFDQSEFRQIAAKRPDFLRSPLKVVGSVEPLTLQLVPDDDGARLVRINANTLRVVFDPKLVGLRPDIQFKADALQIGVGDDDAILIKSSLTSSVSVIKPVEDADAAAEHEDEEAPPELSGLDLLRWQRQKKAEASRARIQAAQESRRAAKAAQTNRIAPPAVEAAQKPVEATQATVEPVQAPAKAVRATRNAKAPQLDLFKAPEAGSEEPSILSMKVGTGKSHTTKFIQQTVAQEKDLVEATTPVTEDVATLASTIEPHSHTPRILQTLFRRWERRRNGDAARIASAIEHLAVADQVEPIAIEAIAEFYGAELPRTPADSPMGETDDRVDDVVDAQDVVEAADETPRGRALHLITSIDGQAGWRLHDATGIGLDEAVSIINQASAQIENDGDTIRARSEAPAPRFDRSVLRWDILKAIAEAEVLSRDDLEELFGTIPFAHVARALRRLATDGFIRILPTGIVRIGAIPDEPLFHRVAVVLRDRPHGMRLTALRALFPDEVESEIERAANTLVSRDHADLRDGRFVWRGLAETGEGFVDDVPVRSVRDGLQRLDFSDFQAAAAPPIERTPTGAVLTAYVDRTRPSGNRYVGKDQLLHEIEAAGAAGIDRKSLLQRLIGVAPTTLSSYLSNLMTSNKVIKNGKRYRLLLARPSMA